MTREMPKVRTVVLLDAYQRLLLLLTMAQVLLPLANVPMLECTIEFLARNGVQELFVFCVSHADQVRQYIENSRCGRSDLLPLIPHFLLCESRWLETIDVHCISSTSCMSAGDVLREMDSMAVIRC
jgi:translation initiation factor eIF-2B subunit epsilon